MAFSKIGNSLPDFLVSIFGEKHRDFVVLSLNWRHIAGDFLTNYSKVSKLENKTLFVSVSNSVVMQELILIKDDLKMKIGRNLNIPVKDIIFYTSNDQKQSKNSTFNPVGRFC
jgi:hypothetical protein